MKYDEHDIPQFQEEICKGKCKTKGRCITEGRDNHWFLMCPQYHKWKLGYTNFVFEQLEWEIAHQDELAKINEQNKKPARKAKRRTR